MIRLVRLRGREPMLKPRLRCSGICGICAKSAELTIYRRLGTVPGFNGQNDWLRLQNFNPIRMMVGGN